jgi:DNA-binding GntR family transcriptional regulator
MQKLHISRTNCSLKEHVVNHLRGVVLDDTFEPGQKLIERDLCEMLDISRTLLRESLQLLIAEGLITSIPYRGLTVATISIHQAREIYDVRQTLETLAVTSFVDHASDSQVAELRQCVEDLKKASDEKAYKNILEIKNNFYHVLLAGSNNKVLLEMHTMLNNRINLLRRTSLSSGGRLNSTIAEIDAIVTAIEQKDGKLAGELSAQHVAIAANVALSRLEQMQGDKK